MITDTIVHYIEYLDMIMVESNWLSLATQFETLVVSLMGFWPTILNIIGYINYFIPLSTLSVILGLVLLFWVLRIGTAIVNLIWP